ncbi:hypothetical protein An07g07990 [Aspergillus niger]|uniref:Uncharacterized protein n=2 Tax=Aspergillus niger TaxID=5061 RepID=A2QP28_ASPNC|nr:hypothetical protein An07g07990 [Aspergillus niger]CAK39615.1 hypothetical protein An07g07990 [Aspergillus niger]
MAPGVDWGAGSIVCFGGLRRDSELLVAMVCKGIFSIDIRDAQKARGAQGYQWPGFRRSYVEAIEAHVVQLEIEQTVFAFAGAGIRGQGTEIVPTDRANELNFFSGRWDGARRRGSIDCTRCRLLAHSLKKCNGIRGKELWGGGGKEPRFGDEEREAEVYIRIQLRTES